MYIFTRGYINVKKCQMSKIRRSAFSVITVYKVHDMVFFVSTNEWVGLESEMAQSLIKPLALGTAVSYLTATYFESLWVSFI